MTSEAEADEGIFQQAEHIEVLKTMTLRWREERREKRIRYVPKLDH